MGRVLAVKELYGENTCSVDVFRECSDSSLKKLAVLITAFFYFSLKLD
jgi:hypothetical protein